jgi:N12 class adenine-specific DNA methylase
VALARDPLPDFTPKNRVRIFNEIKNNSWDAVILTHDRVAALGSPDGSQRALNMLFALRTIQERTGDRLVIDSVPRHDDENRPAKGFKL